MSIKIAINGMGRIGRAAFKIAHRRQEEIEIVAINDLTPIEEIAYLLKYDSVYGIWDSTVKNSEKELIIDDKKIAYLQEPDPEKLPWKDLEVDVVLECTGVFNKSEKASCKFKSIGGRKNSGSTA
jgi:glyceraldehyde 3-phosphate dehydrogenase